MSDDDFLDEADGEFAHEYADEMIGKEEYSHQRGNSQETEEEQQEQENPLHQPPPQSHPQAPTQQIQRDSHRTKATALPLPFPSLTPSSSPPMPDDPMSFPSLVEDENQMDTIVPISHNNALHTTMSGSASNAGVHLNTHAPVAASSILNNPHGLAPTPMVAPSEPSIPLSQAYPTFGEDFISDSRSHHSVRQSEFIHQQAKRRPIDNKIHTIPPPPPPPPPPPALPQRAASSISSNALTNSAMSPSHASISHSPRQSLPRRPPPPQPSTVSVIGSPSIPPVPSTTSASVSASVSAANLDSETDVMSRFLSEEMDLDSDQFDAIFQTVGGTTSATSSNQPSTNLPPPILATPISSSNISLAPVVAPLPTISAPIVLPIRTHQPTLSLMPLRTLPKLRPELIVPQSNVAKLHPIPSPQLSLPPPLPPSQPSSIMASSVAPAHSSIQPHQQINVASYVEANEHAPEVTLAPAPSTTPVRVSALPTASSSFSPAKASSSVQSPPIRSSPSVSFSSAGQSSVVAQSTSSSSPHTPSSHRSPALKSAPTPVPKLEFPPGSSSSPSPYRRHGTSTPLNSTPHLLTYTVKLLDASSSPSSSSSSSYRTVDRAFPGPIGRLKRKLKSDPYMSENGRATPLKRIVVSQDDTGRLTPVKKTNFTGRVDLTLDPTQRQEPLPDDEDHYRYDSDEDEHLFDSDFLLESWQTMLADRNITMPSIEDIRLEYHSVYEPHPSLEPRSVVRTSPWNFNLHFLSSIGVCLRTKIHTLFVMVVACTLNGSTSADGRLRLKDPFGEITATVSHDAIAWYQDITAPHTVIQLAEVGIFYADITQPAHRTLIITKKNIVQTWRQPEEAQHRYGQQQFNCAEQIEEPMTIEPTQISSA